MPTDQKNQPGRDPEQEHQGEDESIEDEVRRNAQRHGGFDNEGRPVKPPEVEPVTEEESKLAEEYGERGRSRGEN
jgi:hypothetical protein